MGDFALLGGEGRASEAVEDSVGVACDEDMDAGTEVDLNTGLVTP